MNPQAATLLATIERSGNIEDIRDEITAFYAEHRMSAFVKNAWKVFHEEEPLLWNWHIDCICDHLEALVEGEFVWLIINVPPGFAKSLLVSVFFPAWVWLRRPWYKFLASSTNDHVTLRDARRHRQLIESAWYRRTFRPEWTISKNQAADGNFGTTRGGERVSRTVNSSIVGARPHCKILDDPNNPEKVNLDEYHKTNHWIESVWLRRRARITSPVVEIQQRIHELDATGYLINREHPKMVHLVLPNRYVPTKAFVSVVQNWRTKEPWRDPRTYEDELLHEPTLDMATTMQERTANQAVDSAQNQQDPTPAGGIIFQREHFRRWSHNPTIDQWPPSREPDFKKGDFPRYPLPDPMDMLIITADLNNLKDDVASRKTDYAVFDVWGLKAKQIYLVMQLRQKLNVSASIVALKQMIDTYKATKRLAAVLIESKANGPAVINSLRALMGLSAEEKRPVTQQFIRGFDVQGEQKTQRARAVAHLVEAGQVYIPDETAYGDYNYWLNEITGFPNKTYDDRVDTMTMALSFFERVEAQFGRV